MPWMHLFKYEMECRPKCTSKQIDGVSKWNLSASKTNIAIKQQQFKVLSTGVNAHP